MGFAPFRLPLISECNPQMPRLYGIFFFFTCFLLCLPLRGKDTYKYKNLTKIVQRIVGVKDDGLFGSDTKEAVKQWQKAHGLTADGAVGINTWKAMLGVTR